MAFHEQCRGTLFTVAVFIMCASIDSATGASITASDQWLAPPPLEFPLSSPSSSSSPKTSMSPPSMYPDSLRLLRDNSSFLPTEDDQENNQFAGRERAQGVSSKSTDYMAQRIREMIVLNEEKANDQEHQKKFLDLRLSGDEVHFLETLLLELNSSTPADETILLAAMTDAPVSALHLTAHAQLTDMHAQLENGFPPHEGAANNSQLPPIEEMLSRVRALRMGISLLEVDEGGGSPTAFGYDSSPHQKFTFTKPAEHSYPAGNIASSSSSSTTTTSSSSFLDVHHAEQRHTDTDNPDEPDVSSSSIVEDFGDFGNDKEVTSDLNQVVGAAKTASNTTRETATSESSSDKKREALTLAKFFLTKIWVKFYKTARAIVRDGTAMTQCLAREIYPGNVSKKSLKLSEVERRELIDRRVGHVAEWMKRFNGLRLRVGFVRFGLTHELRGVGSSMSLAIPLIQTPPVASLQAGIRKMREGMAAKLKEFIEKAEAKEGVMGCLAQASFDLRPIKAMRSVFERLNKSLDLLEKDEETKELDATRELDEKAESEGVAETEEGTCEFLQPGDAEGGGKEMQASSEPGYETGGSANTNASSIIEGEEEEEGMVGDKNNQKKEKGNSFKEKVKKYSKLALRKAARGLKHMFLNKKSRVQVELAIGFRLDGGALALSLGASAATFGVAAGATAAAFSGSIALEVAVPRPSGSYGPITERAKLFKSLRDFNQSADHGNLTSQERNKIRGEMKGDSTKKSLLHVLNRAISTQILIFAFNVNAMPPVLYPTFSTRQVFSVGNLVGDIVEALSIFVESWLGNTCKRTEKLLSQHWESPDTGRGVVVNSTSGGQGMTPKRLKFTQLLNHFTCWFSRSFRMEGGIVGKIKDVFDAISRWKRRTKSKWARDNLGPIQRLNMALSGGEMPEVVDTTEKVEWFANRAFIIRNKTHIAEDILNIISSFYDMQFTFQLDTMPPGFSVTWLNTFIGGKLMVKLFNYVLRHFGSFLKDFWPVMKTKSKEIFKQMWHTLKLLTRGLTATIAKS
eukprot:jgi/Bigna1/70103/fgenesh1_pg.10_\